MRLADFIEENPGPILAEWVEFAEKCDPSKTMDLEALRDHAREILTNITADLRTPQTEAEQTAKSKGQAASNTEPASDSDSGPDSAAEVHGALRAESGFTLDEMVSEYRALRASVIRLWTAACGGLNGEDLDDLMRFNEAIDQALADSVIRYTQDLDHSKEMFIAILGHDLRTPLGAVILSSEVMLETGELKEPHLTLAAGIARSSTRMNQMVDDLLDFTRGRLGSGVPITRQRADMAQVAHDAVTEMTAARPASILELKTSGDLQGEWDSPRISQVIANLLSNAVQHGAQDKPITVTVDGEPEQVVLCVHNFGTPIPTSELHGLFSPLKRLKAGEATSHDSGNLGLGLYIAERIVTAHGGTIDVKSTEEAGTSFTICLPR